MVSEPYVAQSFRSFSYKSCCRHPVLDLCSVSVFAMNKRPVATKFYSLVHLGTCIWAELSKILAIFQEPAWAPVVVAMEGQSGTQWSCIKDILPNTTHSPALYDEITKGVFKTKGSMDGTIPFIVIDVELSILQTVRVEVSAAPNENMSVSKQTFRSLKLLVPELAG